MGVYTIDQLRRTAPEHLRTVDDRTLVREYIAASGIPFEQAAEYFRLPVNSTVREMGRQFRVGLTNDLPRMGAQAARYFSPEDSPLHQRAQGLVDRIDDRAHLTE